MGKIAVVGSINMDVVNRVVKHPLPGETIKGLGTEYNPGGKGANQAVAAAQGGGDVTMIGAVGTDAFGGELLATLKERGVGTSGVAAKEGTSGLAFITVSEEGENNIILSEGANGRVLPEDIDLFAAELEGADVVLLQNEIPWETTLYTMQLAKEKGVRVFFNPAPAFKLPESAFSYIDVCILNETEAGEITGLPVESQEEAETAASKLIEGGMNCVILTLGVKGSVLVNQAGERIVTPSFKVTPVDTTAAGDTFIGAFAVASAEGKSLAEGLRFASAAAAITVTRSGAQMSIPGRQEIERFLAGQ
ncbi:ribokinase [Paenibacillus thalictri]|uniref:Ribokinase n=1 Tax=Paenibacillus thalictri TaxID=2527873 RepID=A0A4Q9DJ52_9BACL|nr:ribokinase [Paenibacillus thalictri]TBL71433.1 ribokinase [Paenibacillus thalictri]